MTMYKMTVHEENVLAHLEWLAKDLESVATVTRERIDRYRAGSYVDMRSGERDPADIVGTTISKIQWLEANFGYDRLIMLLDKAIRNSTPREEWEEIDEVPKSDD